MKATDLRIGNWISHMDHSDIWEDEQLQIQAFDYYSFEDEVKPIPLSDEWLVKLGLEKHSVDDFYFIDLGEYILQVVVNGFSGTLEKDSNWFVSINTGFGSQPVTITKRYVHQIQNLYFALTGEELTIKDMKEEKKKAKELIDKFDNAMYAVESVEDSLINAKKCALICCD